MQFTQFMRPDGRRKSVTIDRPAEIEAKAHAVVGAGFAFEIEMLLSGEISMECCNFDGETVLAGEVCENGPAVPDAVDRLVNAAFWALFEAVSEKVATP